MSFRDRTVTLADGLQKDSFGRLRVSEPYTQVDITQVESPRNDLLSVLVANGGTRTHQINESVSDLTVTTTGDRVVLQSKRSGFYQAGKSLLIEQTGVLAATTVNTRSRIGYFDDHNDKTVDSRGNGFYFQYFNGAVSIVKRSYVTGAQVETEVLQADWNYDKMDGTGVSGKTFNPTKSNIFIIDGQWLGTGTVRVGLMINGAPRLVHSFHHAGETDTTYTTSFNLPLRWEIESFGGAATMKASCGSIQSEGGFEPKGIPLSVNTGLTAITNSTTENQLLAIRSKDAFTRFSLNPLAVNVLLDSVNPSILRVYLCDTTIGGTWVDTGFGSESNLGITSFTGRLVSTFYSSSSNRQGLASLKDLVFTGAEIDGTQQSILITGYAPAGNALCWVGLDYQEVR